MLHEIKSESLAVTIADYGGRLARIVYGGGSSATDVLLGHEDEAAYRDDPHFLGATLGRFANRIGGARFELEGEAFRLDANEHGNTLHGGAGGFHAKSWSVEAKERDRLVLQLVNPDGDQGFPGTLCVRTHFSVEGGTLTVSYEAQTDRPTPISLSQHPYFNLGGAGCGTVEDHAVSIVSGRIVVVDDEGIPTGDVRAVDDTVFDLRRPVRLGEVLPRPAPVGFDHCYLGAGEGVCAEVVHAPSGRRLRLASDQPALQFYTGGKLDGGFMPFGGLCLEPQDVPDAPNQSAFAATILRPGETYRRSIRYSFDEI